MKLGALGRLGCSGGYLLSLTFIFLLSFKEDPPLTPLMSDMVYLLLLDLLTAYDFIISL